MSSSKRRHFCATSALSSGVESCISSRPWAIRDATIPLSCFLPKDICNLRRSPTKGYPASPHRPNLKFISFLHHKGSFEWLHTCRWLEEDATETFPDPLGHSFRPLMLESVSWLGDYSCYSIIETIVEFLNINQTGFLLVENITGCNLPHTLPAARTPLRKPITLGADLTMRSWYNFGALWNPLDRLRVRSVGSQIIVFNSFIDIRLP